MRALTVALCALAACALTLATDTPVDAGIARQAPDDEVASIQIALIEQRFTFDVGTELRLVYQLSGDLTWLEPIVDTATTTTPEITSPPSTDEPAEAPPPTFAPVTVDIANFAPVDELDTATLGNDADPAAFSDNIDGVRIDDAKPNIERLDDGTALLELKVPTDAGGDDDGGPDSLQFPEPGVYPIRVQLRVEDTLIATHGTAVDRLVTSGEISRPSAPVNFAFVAAAGAGESEAVDDREALARVNAIAETAAAAKVSLLASIPTALLVDAIDQQADSAAFLEALATTELVAQPVPPLDVSSAVGAGIGELYSQGLGTGEDVITNAFSRPPTRLVSIITDPLSASGAQLLRTLGVRYLVMTPARFRADTSHSLPDTDRFVEIELPEGGSLPVLLTDPLSNEFSSDSADEILAAATPTEWALRTVASTVLEHRSRGRTVQRSRLIGLDTYAPPDPRLVNALATMAATTPDVEVVAPTALVGVTDTQRLDGGAGIELPERAGIDLLPRVEAINGARLKLASIASMLPTDDPRIEAWTEHLDALLSTAVDEADAAAVLDELDNEVAAIRAGVIAPEPFTFTMTGRSDTVRIRLRNVSSERLRVAVRLTSSRLEVPNNDRIVTLRPNDTTDINIGVEALSNGTSPVTVEVLTPFGEPLFDPVTLTVRVNSLTGLGQVLTGGFVLILATWWITNWRGRQRASAKE